MKAPPPNDEAARLDALRRYHILDTSPEEAFDDLARLASLICETPVALVTLIDGARQWFKSKVGLALTQTPRDVSFCAHAILSPDLFIVQDALADERFADNPLVTADPKIRFYAGAPLINPGGHALGTLCVIDRVPRELSPEQQEALRALSRQVVTELELRRALTELERTAAERRESEEALSQLASIVESSDDAIISTTLDHTILSWNKGAEKIYGYSAEEVKGRSVSILFPPERPEEIAHIFEKAKQGESLDHYETVRVRKDGRRINVYSTISPIKDRTGQTVGAVAITRDITKRKQAEEERDRFFTLSIDMLCIAGFDGYFKRLNPAWERTLGFTVEELTAEPFLHFVHPDDREATMAETQKVVSGSDAIFFENRYRCQDGSYKWLVWMATPYVDQQLIYATARDITEHKQAEAALRESEARYKHLVEHANDIIYRVDAQGHFTFCNPTAISLLGYSPEELIGRSYLDLIRPDFHRKMKKLYTSQLVNQAQNTYYEFPVVTKAGAEKWLGQNVQLVIEKGQVVGFQAIARDITERKAMEAELALARDAALESARLKSEFLANVSHEIRTPMNGIIGMTGLLLDTPLAPEQRKFAETVQSSADALLTIINDLLDISKIEAGKLKVETLDFDLRATVEGAVEILAERAQSKGIELALLVYRDVPTLLRGDPGRLRQVLTNLAGNAIKFTDRGEVVVRVTKEAETADRVVVRVTVSDTGIGIPEEAQQYIFQAFAQADGSTTRKYGGTGLGLAISQQLVGLMGGEISVESEAGRGSTFSFTLPFEKQPAGAVAAPPVKAELTDARVLVVDDNATNRMLLHYQVTSWGMRNGSAASGPEALALLHREAAAGDPYDLAILDLQMPEMDGLMLAKAIKADATTAATRIIIMTSLGHRIEAEAMRAAGVAAYLTKPVKQSQLYDCLATVMASGLSLATAPESSRPDTQQWTPPLPAPGQEGSQRARILVAEDNPVNQEVALRQLYKLGYTAEAVANGREVLEALASTAYDLVLIDCQMPEMDGYETTEEIRRREGDSRHTAVIAMTANALESDRERCLAAGMDDYLSKPVRPRELAAVLERWLSAPAGAGAVGAAPSAAPISSQADPVDAGVLASLRELQAEGEPNLLVKLIDLFFVHTPPRLAALREARAQGDMKVLAQTAHALKGICGNLGATQMTALCGAIEQQSLAGRLPEVDALLTQLDEEFQRVSRALEAQKGASA